MNLKLEIISSVQTQEQTHRTDIKHTAGSDLIDYKIFNLCCRVQKSQG